MHLAAVWMLSDGATAQMFYDLADAITAQTGVLANGGFSAFLKTSIRLLLITTPDTTATVH